MLHVVCINANDYQGRGRDYVNLLFDMVRRNLPAGFAGTFEAFTDDQPTGYHPDITLRPLPVQGLAGWWNKLALFRAGLFPERDRVLYLDLDTLVTGRLDDVAGYNGDFAILRDAYRPLGLQSSVMAWRVGTAATEIWRTWIAAGRPVVDGGDQAWIERVMRAPEILQDRFPGLFGSYKVTGGKLPDHASVVFFHGHPRPHEVLTGWVPEVWKVGGLTRAELDTISNTALAKLSANVRQNANRDLPWLDYAAAHDGHVAIVGGGPSLAGFADEIALRQSAGQKVWALNGSARWLLDHGVTPDAQLIVDARPDNERFLDNAGEYLLASQCDPALFERGAWFNATVWHSNAPGIEEVLKDETKRPVHLIGGGSTVGLSAMVIAHVRGFRQIHLYGYDSSYADDAHHAYPQGLNDADAVVDVVAGTRRFRAAPWMVQQAQEFVGLATHLADQDCVITVHGDGLLPYLAHDLAAHPIRTPAEVRAAEVLARLPEGPVAGAEIGVFRGDMSRALLSRADLLLLMVDGWEGQGASYAGDSGDWHATLTQERQDGYRAAATAVADVSGGRARIIAARSVAAAAGVDDASLDFVFIDADHSYAGARADIAAWAPKLKPGGLLSGHDYDNPDFPQFGVRRAVDEFVAVAGLTLELGANLTWFARMPDTLSERTRKRA